MYIACTTFSSHFSRGTLYFNTETFAKSKLVSLMSLITFM